MLIWKVVFLAILAVVNASPARISSRSEEKCSFEELNDEKMFKKHMYSCSQVKITLEGHPRKTHATITIEPHDTESDENPVLRLSELPNGIKILEKVDSYSVFVSNLEFESEKETISNIFEQLGIDSRQISALEVAACTGFGLVHLTNLEELWSLTVYDTFEGLENELGSVLPQLRVLYLSEVGIESLPSLKNLNFLEDFSVECNICREIPQKYFESNAFLSKLYIMTPEMTEFHDDFCSNLTNLDELDLQIKGTNFPVLTKCDALSSLQIWNEEKGEKVPKISGLSNLREFWFTNSAMKTLPDDIFMKNSHLKAVSLYDNDIQDVPVDIFSHLWDLQYLDLSGNQIKNFSDALILSENFQYLDLERNFLTNFVPSKELPHLLSLILSENQLQGKLSLKSFIEHYPQVSYLSLDDNLYTELELEGPFYGKEDIIQVDLSKNQITTITIDPKTVGSKTFEDETRVKLDLSGNPLKCDCRIRPFVEALRQKDSNIYLISDVKCADKRGKSLKTINLEEMKC